MSRRVTPADDLITLALGSGARTVARLVQETLLSRNWVEQSLRRLIDNGRVARETGPGGKPRKWGAKHQLTRKGTWAFKEARREFCGFVVQAHVGRRQRSYTAAGLEVLHKVPMPCSLGRMNKGESTEVPDFRLVRSGEEIARAAGPQDRRFDGFGRDRERLADLASEPGRLIMCEGDRAGANTALLCGAAASATIAARAQVVDCRWEGFGDAARAFIPKEAGGGGTLRGILLLDEVPDTSPELDGLCNELGRSSVQRSISLIAAGATLERCAPLKVMKRRWELVRFKPTIP